MFLGVEGRAKGEVLEAGEEEDVRLGGDSGGGGGVVGFGDGEVGDDHVLDFDRKVFE